MKEAGLDSLHFLFMWSANSRSHRIDPKILNCIGSICPVLFIGLLHMKPHQVMTIRVFVLYSFFFWYHVVFKVLYRFWHVFYFILTILIFLYIRVVFMLFFVSRLRYYRDFDTYFLLFLQFWYFRISVSYRVHVIFHVVFKVLYRFWYVFSFILAILRYYIFYPCLIMLFFVSYCIFFNHILIIFSYHHVQYCQV